MLRTLGIGIALGLLAGWLVQLVRGRRQAADEWHAPAPPPPASVAGATLAPSGPVEPVPPAEADPADRERESRLDDETKYSRSLDEEERERAAAAARLQADPLVSEPRADEQ